MHRIQNKLRDIDTNAENHETKPAAHMHRLLENLNDDLNHMQYYRKKDWANRENATKKDVFLMIQILIDKFKSNDSDKTANKVKGKYRQNKGQSKSKGNKCKEEHLSWVSAQATNTATKTNQHKRP